MLFYKIEIAILYITGYCLTHLCLRIVYIFADLVSLYIPIILFWVGYVYISSNS